MSSAANVSAAFSSGRRRTFSFFDASKNRQIQVVKTEQADSDVRPFWSLL